MVLLALCAVSAPARAQDAAAPAVDQAASGTETAEPSVAPPVILGMIKIGGLLGWDMGGVASAGVLVGRRVPRLQVAARGMAGMTVGGNESVMAIGGEAGHRAIWKVHPKLRVTLLTAASYMYRRAHNAVTDAYFRYHVVQGHVAGGVMFGRRTRLTHGVEVGFDGGYAFHLNPSSSASDYSGFYGGGELCYVLTF